ncbi:MAG: PLP-dependent decarboxylase [Bdellovibrionota bacterium]
MSEIIQKLIQENDSSFYFYDLDGFESHIRSIKSVLHPDVKVWYACKANPLSKILSIYQDNGFGVDVASLGELHQAKTAGVKKLISTGPAKTPKYLRAMMEAGVSTIVVESIQQLRDLDIVAGTLGRKQDILLRLQLDWSGHLKSVLGGSAITPFGLHPQDWEKEKFSEYANLHVLGLHCFQWGNILDVNELKKIWDETISQCVNFAQKMNIDLKVLDLGGGLGVSYSTDERLAFSSVHEILMEMKTKYSLREIWLELGRFSIAEFGHYFTKVVDVKDVRGKKIIVTEGGINHLARPALVNESFPVSAFRDSPKSKFSLHGPLCTALDYLGDHELPVDISSGEWLHFKKTGAYGFTESMPYFLCHELCGEAYLYHGEVQMIRTPSSPVSWMK